MVRDVADRSRDRHERHYWWIGSKAVLQSGYRFNDCQNGSNGELTLNKNVLALPKVVRGVENAGIDVRRILPGLPLSPIAAKVPRVAEAVRTIGFVRERVLSI